MKLPRDRRNEARICKLRLCKVTGTRMICECGGPTTEVASEEGKKLMAMREARKMSSGQSLPKKRKIQRGQGDAVNAVSL